MANNREPLKDTTGDTICVSDIMKKYKCSKGKAIKIIKHSSLHAYLLGEEWFCERQYWDSFINMLCDTGGTRSISFAFGAPSFQPSKPNPIREFVSEILTDEEFGRFIDAIFEESEN